MKTETKYMIAGGVVFGLILLAASRSEAGAPPAGSTSIHPYAWARRHLPVMRGWVGGEVGRTIRAMSPIVWPGVPYEAFMAFAANGSATGAVDEDTALPPPKGLGPERQHFHELGIFGTEGGRVDESTYGTYPGYDWGYPVPLAPSNGTDDNSWRALAHNETVQVLLGRPASMELNGWINVPDQVAVGLVNIRRHLNNVSRAVPEVTPRDPNSLWAVALGSGAWSAGTTGMSRHMRRYADAIKNLPDEMRWGAFLAAVADDVQRGNVSGHRHDNPAYTAIRTWQKLEAARQLSGSEWFATRLENEAQVASILDAEFKRAGGRA